MKKGIESGLQVADLGGAGCSKSTEGSKTSIRKLLMNCSSSIPAITDTIKITMHRASGGTAGSIRVKINKGLEFELSAVCDFKYPPTDLPTMKNRRYRTAM